MHLDEHCLLLTYVTTLRQRWRRRVAIEELFETSRRDIENQSTMPSKSYGDAGKCKDKRYIEQ